jgi:hypothetical protein
LPPAPPLRSHPARPLIFPPPHSRRVSPRRRCRIRLAVVESLSLLWNLSPLSRPVVVAVSVLVSFHTGGGVEDVSRGWEDTW